MKYGEYVAHVKKIHDEYVRDVRYYSEKNFKELNPEVQAELAVQLSGRFLKCCTDSSMILYKLKRDYPNNEEAQKFYKKTEMYFGIIKRDLWEMYDNLQNIRFPQRALQNV